MNFVESPKNLSKKTLLWLVPEKQGGIATYSEVLFPEIKKLAKESLDWECLISDDLDSTETCEAIKRADIIHLQHEFGLFGRKLPFSYRFGKTVNGLKLLNPAAKWVITSHTVLDPKYPYGITFFRKILNLLLGPWLKARFLKVTYQHMDAVIVHSDLQVPLIELVTRVLVVCIPHFVPKLKNSYQESNAFSKKPRKLVVFGYFTPEKGQDIAIQALPFLIQKKETDSYHLVLAGGTRRIEDLRYFDKCKDLILKLGIQGSVTITGYIGTNELDQIYQDASLVIAPFRETSGSGSIVNAIGRGMPILASDHPINVDLNQRVQGLLATYRNLDAQDLARKIDFLFNHPKDLSELAKKSVQYSDLFSVTKVANLHIELYQKL